MSKIPIPDPEAALAAAVAALRLSEERATAGRLALEVMHELRSPLEALGHLVYLTELEKDNPEKVAAYMTMAEEQMATLNRIASQTLGYASSSRLPRTANLADLAEAALRIHRRAIQTKQVNLVKDLASNVSAQVYTGEILQVVSNLIVNALDALPPNGTLCLRLRKRGNEVLLVVADNGQGIPPEHANSVFEPFFTTKEERGTGLGLALSKNIIERHRGKIRLRSSTRPGRSGTVFKISLPI